MYFVCVLASCLCFYLLFSGFFFVFFFFFLFFEDSNPEHLLQSTSVHFPKLMFIIFHFIIQKQYAILFSPSFSASIMINTDRGDAANKLINIML